VGPRPLSIREEYIADLTIPLLEFVFLVADCKAALNQLRVPVRAKRLLPEEQMDRDVLY
jgi:hypothetical protein